MPQRPLLRPPPQKARTIRVGRACNIITAVRRLWWYHYCKKNPSALFTPRVLLFAADESRKTHNIYATVPNAAQNVVATVQKIDRWGSRALKNRQKQKIRTKDVEKVLLHSNNKTIKLFLLDQSVQYSFIINHGMQRKKTERKQINTKVCRSCVS